MHIQNRPADDPNSALEALRSRVARDPHNTDARCDLGMALLRLEKFDEAVACYKEILRIDPEHADAHVGLGHVLINIGNALKLSQRLSQSEEQQSADIPVQQIDQQTTCTDPAENLANPQRSPLSSIMNQPPILSLKSGLNGTTTLDGPASRAD